MAPPDRTSQTNPTVGELYDYFMDRVPWYEMVLLPTALMLPAACDSSPCYDPGPNECDANGAVETDITFKDNLLSKQDQDQIRNFIRRFEAPLRNINPSLFCHFNGWKVTDEEEIREVAGGDALATYAFCDKTIYISASLFAYGHEFCHYVDDHSGIMSRSGSVSESAEWARVACRGNNLSLENCVTTPHNFDRGLNEEFADVCAPVVAFPTGSVIRFSTNANTLRQSLIAARSLGVGETVLDEIINKRLQPVTAARVTGKLDPEALSRFRNVDDRPFIPMGEGVLGYWRGGNLFGLAIPDGKEEGAWETREIWLPLQLNPEDSFSVDYHNGRVVLTQRRTVWELDLSVTADEWLEINSGRPSDTNDQAVVFINEVPVLLDTQAGTYQAIEVDGPHSEGIFPRNIRSEISQADTWMLIHGDSGPILWINGLSDGKYGKVSRLYQLRYLDGDVTFQQVFEVPTLSNETRPFFLNGNWYLFDTVNFNRLIAAKPEITNFPEFVGAPVLFRIRDKGKIIEPLSIDYQTDNPFDLFHLAMLWLRPATLHVSAGRLVGYAHLRGEDFRRGIVSIKLED